MAVTPNSVILPQAFKRGACAFSSGSTQGSFSVVYSAGPNGSRIKSLMAASTNSTANNVEWQVRDGSGNIYWNISVAVGAAAGEPPVGGGGPSQPLMSPALTPGFPVDANGNQELFLNAGDQIVAAFAYAISSGDFLYIYAMGEDF